MRSLLLASLAGFISLTVLAQQREKLRLFVDCLQADCDFNFIRQEIPVVDFVRDRQESDIHILAISQQAGGGGQRFSIFFLGQGAYAAHSDTLHYFSPANSTRDELRQLLLKTIKAGISSCLVKAGQMESMEISFKRESAENDASLQTDKWNYWVFRIGGSINMSGDKNYKETGINNHTSASRVTDKSKIDLYFYNSTNRNVYSLEENGDTRKLETTNDYTEFEQSYVRSISPKWSWAVESMFRRSSYDNIDRAFGIEAGFEYNIFPYSASSTKFLALRFTVDAEKRKYREETVYDKQQETLFSNDFGVYAAFTQPWGTISSSVSWYNYLHDVSKNNLSLQAFVELQLFRGLSLNFHAYGSLINDQLSLSKEGATQEEVLLRLKALSTNFNYYTGFGLGYRFGSKLNNFVNPRFTNGRH